MNQIEQGMTPRPASAFNRAVDWAMRVVPITALIAVGAYFAAQQAVKPQHRAIKGLVGLLLVGLMFRFDMVYSVYLFTLLFVFPSGISIGSTNNVLMTVIPMVWAVRATSSKLPLARRSPADAAIGLLVLSYFVALFNVNDTELLGKNLVIVWRQLTTCAFFYTIYLFVDDETKLIRFGKVMCVACILVMITAVIELFFPGSTIIPGWIGLKQNLGEGELGYRLQGLRVGGAFESHGMLSDFGTQMVLFMVLFVVTSRNIVEKTFWLLGSATTVIAMLATANRGAAFGLILALVLAFFYFRRQIGAARMALIVVLAFAALIGLDAYMSQKTLAVSVVDRFAHTEFEGGVPDTRTMTWKPALIGGLEKPFFGHGPHYETGIGLTKRFWPHNGYLFYFFTLGLLGLGAFLWVMWKVFRESQLWRHPAIRNTTLGRFMAVAQIWFFVLALEQMRTDHQRDDIYPYIVWMCFGVVVASASIARRKLALLAAAQRGASPP